MTPDPATTKGEEMEPELEAPAEVDLAELEPGAQAVTIAHPDLTPVLDVPVELAVEIGRTRMTIRETLAIAPGALIPLDRVAGEPVDLLVNGRRVARGEVVAIDEEFGLRVTEVVAPELRADAAS